MTVPETLENLIADSPLVVEGKVRSQESFWDTDNKNIYTVNEVEIFKVFQGITTINTIDVVTRGGVVDLEMDRVSNALELQVGEMGMFMLQSFPGNLPVSEILYRPTEGVLGFIRYDLVIGTAQAVYESYSDISSGLYNRITDITGSLFDIGPWDAGDSGLSGEPSIERSIVSGQEGSSNLNFEVHAGVGDLLTITGSDFGEEPGSVLFPDANSGGNRYISTLPHHIKEWSNDRIVLEVPYRAGTGRVRIDKANGESLIGTEDLPIGYDHINVQYSDVNGRKAYETQLTSDNGNGGYDFRFESDFSKNAGATQAFISLIETWSCTTGVNFQIGEVTAVDEDANDGINIVRFDNGEELGGRTLAYARSRYRGCYQGNTIKWFVNEIEVVVNDDYDWYYGDGAPGSSQFDFETVMLHEIGHTQQLGHVINGNEVMHFAVGPGQQKRTLSSIDTIGGVFVTDKSTEEEVCGRGLMEHYGGCCETMAVVNHPSDQVLCPDHATASFEFEVDFADTWQWQIKDGEVWADLIDDGVHSGADSPQLTVERSSGKMAEYRCIAGNSCDESTISNVARLSVRTLQFSLTSKPASCDADGQILLDRMTTEGNLTVSTDGGAFFDLMWPADVTVLSIAASPGSYDVMVQDADSGCSVALGTVTVQGSVRLELSAKVLRKIGCTGTGGQLQVDFNDHPDFDTVLLSIDGGNTFQSFDDAIGFAVFENLKEGNYRVMGMWEDGSCPITTDPVFVGTMACPEDADTPETGDSQDTEDSENVTLKVYPNPASERIYVQNSQGDILRFQLFNARGTLVQEAVARMEGEGIFYMDIAHPQSGVYTLYMITHGENILRQVIVK
jgi:hypothetical protein